MFKKLCYYYLFKKKKKFVSARSRLSCHAKSAEVGASLIIIIIIIIIKNDALSTVRLSGHTMCFYYIIHFYIQFIFCKKKV